MSKIIKLRNILQNFHRETTNYRKFSWFENELGGAARIFTGGYVPGSHRRVNSLYKQQCRDLGTAVVQGIECKTFT